MLPWMERSRGRQRIWHRGVRSCLPLEKVYWKVKMNDVLGLLPIWITRRVSYKKQELLTLRENLGSPPVFGGVHVAHLLGFLCFVLFCFVLFVFVMCLVYSMLSVTLDCPSWFPLWLFLISPVVVLDFPCGCSWFPLWLFLIAPVVVLDFPCGCSWLPLWLFLIAPVVVFNIYWNKPNFRNQ